MSRISLLVTLLFFIARVAQSQWLNVRVSQDSLSRYSPEEVCIAVNPVDPLNLAIGANSDWIFSSSDGGQSWVTQRLNSQYGGGGDPSLVFDGDGNLYYVTLGGRHLGIDRSTDGGLTFDTGAIVGNDTSQQDKPWLAINRNLEFGNQTVAAGWTRFAQYGSRDVIDSTHILSSVSTDQGVTWTNPARVDDIGGDCIDSSNTTEGAVPAFGLHNELYMTWSARDTIFFDRSLDGGSTFGQDRPIAVQPGGWWLNVPKIVRTNGLPSMVCDQSSGTYSGRIYVLWSDARRGVVDCYIVHSTDNGDSWSDPVRIDTDEQMDHHFFPSLAVDPITGHIFVAYYQMHLQDKDSVDVYLARSTNGGESFEDMKISQSAFSPGNGVFLGDYISVAAYNKHVFPTWTRTKSGISSIWTAIVIDSDRSSGVYSSIPPGGIPSLSASSNSDFICSLSAASHIKIELIDELGRNRAKLSEGYYETGEYRFKLPENISHCLYFLRMTAQNQSSFNIVTLKILK
ncbi:MAG TPA: sialidase family protein [Candidatus Kapabacteria bacterium]|nr:sialidase family protein [Candidatus Kapabacteria bacterium]